MARHGWLRVLVLALGVTAPAHAHTFEHPKVLRLGIRSGRALLDVRYDVNPGDASARLRGLFDRDADGVLEPAEREKLAAYLDQMATLFLEVAVDGAPAKLERLETTLSGADRPVGSSDAVGISILMAVALPTSGDVRLEISDRPRDAAMDVPVTVDLGPGVDVRLATQGELFPDVRQIREVQLKDAAPLGLKIRLGGG